MVFLAQTSETEENKMERDQEKVSLRRRWDEARATKRVVFGFAVAAIVLTLVVGFNWGGWVTGGSARDTAVQSGKDAVILRLAPICVYQFNQDLEKDQKLTELKEKSAYQRDDYVMEQGWATIPGEEKPDNKVADACAKLLVQIGQ
jgi:hypothetical protein